MHIQEPFKEDQLDPSRVKLCRELRGSGVTALLEPRDPSAIDY